MLQRAPHLFLLHVVLKECERVTAMQGAKTGHARQARASSGPLGGSPAVAEHGRCDAHRKRVDHTRIQQITLNHAENRRRSTIPAQHSPERRNTITCHKPVHAAHHVAALNTREAVIPLLRGHHATAAVTTLRQRATFHRLHDQPIDLPSTTAVR